MKEIELREVRKELHHAKVRSIERRNKRSKKMKEEVELAEVTK